MSGVLEAIVVTDIFSENARRKQVEKPLKSFMRRVAMRSSGRPTTWRVVYPTLGPYITLRQKSRCS